MLRNQCAFAYFVFYSRCMLEKLFLVLQMFHTRNILLTNMAKYVRIMHNHNLILSVVKEVDAYYYVITVRSVRLVILIARIMSVIKARTIRE